MGDSTLPSVAPLAWVLPRLLPPSTALHRLTQHLPPKIVTGCSSHRVRGSEGVVVEAAVLAAQGSDVVVAPLLRIRQHPVGLSR